MLEERGKLKIDDPIQKHISNAPAAWEKITVFHLLTHTSGIPNFTNFPEYRSLQPFLTLVAKTVEQFKEKPLDFQPGEKFSYSNSGYLLLGHLIETITGGSYEKFVQENIFRPLAMKDSGYDSTSAIIPHRAAGYAPSPQGPVNAGFIHMSIPHAAGALYSTTEDLLRWQRGLYEGKLLSPASLQKMTTPHKGDYALGIIVSSAKGRKMMAHGGGIEGFNTYLAYYPDDKLTVVSLANLNGTAPTEMTPKLAALARGESVPVPVERKEITLQPEVLSRYVGTYEMQPSAKLTIRLADGRMTAQLTGQDQLPIFPESDGRFFLKAVDAQLTYEKDEKGTVSGVVLHQNGQDQKARRISTTVEERKQVAVSPLILAKYTGTYELRPGFDFVITLEGGQLMAQPQDNLKSRYSRRQKPSSFPNQFPPRLSFSLTRKARSGVWSCARVDGKQKASASRARWTVWVFIYPLY